MTNVLYSSWQGVVLQEVPGELSLAISISGCPLRCKGCHSSETQKPTYGKPFQPEYLKTLIQHHKHITCVIFYGGEWSPELLVQLLDIPLSKNLKTCLYTGLEIENIPQVILNKLTFLKTGPYVEELGGLNTKTTNQKFHILNN